jgi:hypothetical protein
MDNEYSHLFVPGAIHPRFRHEVKSNSIAIFFMGRACDRASPQMCASDSGKISRETSDTKDHAMIFESSAADKIG